MTHGSDMHIHSVHQGAKDSRDGEGNISEVAKHFGRARKQIYRWIEAFGLDRKSES